MPSVQSCDHSHHPKIRRVIREQSVFNEQQTPKPNTQAQQPFSIFRNRVFAHSFKPSKMIPRMLVRVQDSVFLLIQRTADDQISGDGDWWLAVRQLDYTLLKLGRFECAPSSSRTEAKAKLISKSKKTVKAEKKPTTEHASLVCGMSVHTMRSLFNLFVKTRGLAAARAAPHEVQFLRRVGSLGARAPSALLVSSDSAAMLLSHFGVPDSFVSDFRSTVARQIAGKMTRFSLPPPSETLSSILSEQVVGTRVGLCPSCSSSLSPPVAPPPKLPKQKIVHDDADFGSRPLSKRQPKKSSRLDCHKRLDRLNRKRKPIPTAPCAAILSPLPDPMMHVFRAPSDRPFPYTGLILEQDLRSTVKFHHSRTFQEIWPANKLKLAATQT